MGLYAIYNNDDGMVSGAGLYGMVVSAPTPTISFTEPTLPAGVSTLAVNAPVTLTLQASAFEDGGTITSVTYTITGGSNNPTTLTSNSAPYSVTWTPDASALAYTITAVAMDGNNQSSAPATLSVTVSSPPTTDSITLVAPGAIASIVGPLGNVTLAAEVTSTMNDYQ